MAEDYTQIADPYNDSLARQPGGLSFASGGQNIESGVTQQTQTAPQAGGNTAASSSAGGGPAQQASVASGGALADITIENAIQSKNWSPKKVGFMINGQTGYAEFTDVYVSGDIQALTGTIGGWTINATTLTGGSATLDSAGVLTLGTTNDVVVASASDATYRLWVGNAAAASAPFSVTKAGAVSASNITITGGAVSGVPISGIPNSTVTDISLLECSHDLVFSVTDADTIAWASGTIIFSNGRTFSISGGNTGNMAALTYIYLDPAISSTVLQTTTTYSTAMGANKRLLGTAQNHTVTASFIPYGAGVPLIDGANIGALSIVAGNIAASTIVAEKMNVSTLSSIVADIGTITAGSISVVNGGYTIGLTPAGTNAIFSGTTGAPEFKVTPEGNATVSSLERSDFHWFTLFESIDGYAKGGTPAISADFVSLPTTNVSGNECTLQKTATYSNTFTWAKRRKIKFGVLFNTNTNQQFEMMTGNGAYGVNNRHFGFRVINGALYAVSDDGTNQTETSVVSVISTASAYELEARFVPATSITYYVNGSLLATHSTNLPSGTTDANKLLDFVAHTTENAIKSFYITFYDFWQQN